MSCCENVPICVGGQSYFAKIISNANGSFRAGNYFDENLNLIALTPGAFTFGACSIASLDDVVRVNQPLVAGNNVITHNLGRSDVEVEIRNNANGSEISARVVAETVNTVTIFVPVAVASVRISIDA